MAIAFVQAKSAASNTITLNASPIQGNLLYVLGTRNSTTTVAAPDGTWTALTELTVGGGSARSYRAFYKIAGASESATIAFANTNTMTIHVLEYSGVAASSTLNIDNAQLNASGSPQFTPTVTPSGSGNAIIIGYAAQKNGATYSTEKVNVSTTGVNERTEINNGTSTSGVLYDLAVTGLTGTYFGEAAPSANAIGGGGISIFNEAGGTIALTGTITSSATEADIVAGGKTIILTITGDTWVASGAAFDAQRQNIINGIDSAQAEANGWDAVVKATAAVTDVVRTSATVVTITLEAFATYNITATETITATIPATALTGASAIVATPTFTVAAISGVRSLAALGVG